MKKKLLEMVQDTVLFYTDEFILVATSKMVTSKPLLGCQNWVTSMAGCQNLVPGSHLQRQGPASSFIRLVNLLRKVPQMAN